jgi:hypothetical protein
VRGGDENEGHVRVAMWVIDQVIGLLIECFPFDAMIRRFDCTPA